ncbi:MAG: DUF4267 domain-containing protein [Candidatus Sulfotelmatobacter sp.]
MIGFGQSALSSCEFRSSWDSLASSHLWPLPPRAAIAVSPEIRSRGSLRSRSVGIALLVLAIIPFGDMSIILGSGGSKSRAFSIHGVTCAVMLVVGLWLIHAI